MDGVQSDYGAIGRAMRGHYGAGAAYSREMAANRAQRMELRQQAKAAAQSRSRPVHFEDGSVGYGKYTRKRMMPVRRSLQRRVRGRGGYFDNLAKGASGFVKSIFGGRASGMGAYTSGIPSSVEDQQIPTITNPGGSDGPVVVRHKEFITDIIAGNPNSATTGQTLPFALVQSLVVNPGNPLCFPWLSTIAGSFTQYRFQGLQFWYKSTSGSLSTTQSLGEIVLSAEYNVNSAAPTNKQNMLNQIFSVSKVPAFDAHCDIECDPSQTAGVGLLYVSSGVANADDPSAVQDKRFNNLCNFYVATQGSTVGASNGVPTLGELWVTYQVALYKPELPVDFEAGQSARVHCGPLALASGTTHALNALVGGVPIVREHDSFGLIFPAGSAEIAFPKLPIGTVLCVNTSVLIDTGATYSSVGLPSCSGVGPVDCCMAVVSSEIQFDQQNYVIAQDGFNLSITQYFKILDSSVPFIWVAPTFNVATGISADQEIASTIIVSTYPSTF